MSFFSRLLGYPEDASEAKIQIKALTKQVKNLTKENENLREEMEDADHDASRWQRRELREARESAEDAQYSADRQVALAEREAEDSSEDAARAFKKAHKAELDKKDVEIANATSKVRTLELQLKEKGQDTDLAIQEGILEYKEEHMEEVKNLEVKLAVSQGETKSAQAESKQKDIVIKVLTDLLTKAGETNDSLVEAITEVAPKINLEKLGFEVTVPAAAKQGGGDQKKQN